MKISSVPQLSRHPKLICGASVNPKWLGSAVVLAMMIMLCGSAWASDYYWQTTNAVSGNWNVAANWGGVNYPGGSDNALIAGTNTGTYSITNNVSANQIQNLIFDLTAGTAANTSAGTITTTISPGTSLSVLGSQGFYIMRDIGVKVNSTHKFIGDTLTVSNAAAKVVLNSGQGVGNNTAAIIDFFGLTNLNIAVGYFGAADCRLSGGAAVGDQVIKATLARTNIIFAANKDDFNSGDYTNSIEFCRMDSNGSNGDAQNSFFKLGISNLFLADSIGIGRGFNNCAGGGSLSGYNTFAPNVNQGFQVLFNNTALTSTAQFRNTNGVDRVSLLALCVQSGTNLIPSSTRLGATLNFNGGNVDMLVDQIWMSRNYTNTSTTQGLRGSGLVFDNGTIDANTVYCGFMQYTNGDQCKGFIVVGSNAVMKVNNKLILGYTPTNDPAGDFLVAEANTLGQVQINNGSGVSGALYANKIEVGLASTNNQVVVNGLLVVSNSIANPTNSLTVLNVGSTGQIEFKVAPGFTNAFVNNLVVAAGAKIGITEAPSGAEASYVVISYKGTSPVNSFSVGDKPSNIKNVVITDDGANIILTLSTNAPKSLVWRGSENSNWDHSSTNWFYPAGGTNCAFSESDKVQFDDQPGVPTTINVTETVTPSQVGSGIVMTNSTNAFVFSNGGSGLIQNVQMLKTGTNSLQIDVPTTVGLTIQQGSLKGSGSASSASIASGASMNFSGTIAGALTVSGNATLAYGGKVNGSVSVATGGSFSNSGTVNGPVSMSSGSTINNGVGGVMSAMGATTIRTNCVFNNAGTIYGTTITVDLGGTLVDTYAGSVGPGAGSINVWQLAVFGTFIPGGSNLQTTKVADYDYSGLLLNPNGRVNLNAGSTTIMKVNMDLAPGQVNTLLLSQNQGFGGSFGFKNFAGGTLMITNVGTTPFAAGQSFKMFGNYYGGDCFDAGANTTNTYPVISPSVPGPGLVWQLDQLIPQGIIKILSANDPSLKFTLTNSQYVFNDNGTNKIVTQLSWPEDKTNAWVQYLNTGLTNGLSATNWVNLNQSAMTNMPAGNVYIVTNNVVGNTATFYRLVWP